MQAPSFFFLLEMLKYNFALNLFLSFQEVEETPAKKSRRGKGPAVNRSPSLNRGKPSAGSIPKVMFTGLVDRQGEKVSSTLECVGD